MSTALMLVIGFCFLGFFCVMSVAVGLPGTWIMLIVAVAMELGDVWWLPEGAVSFGWTAIGLCAGAAVLGELLEVLSGVLGTKMGGGSRRSSVGAFVGGLAGGVLGTMMLPLVGTLIGALVGTFVGAYVGEVTGAEPREGKDAVKPALAATAARVVASVAKVGIAMVVWLGLGAAAVMALP